MPDSSNLQATMLIEYSRPGVSLDGDLLGSLLGDLA